jgi:von Willebrand factor type A domain
MKQLKLVFLMGLALTLNGCGGAASGDPSGSSSGAIGSSGSTGSSGTGSPSSGSTGGSSSSGTKPSGSSSSGSSSISSSSGSLPPPTGTSSSSGSSIPVQAGTLTAGDYDDLLNFTLYQNYISDYLQSNGPTNTVPVVDISKKVAIKIVDSAGLAINGASVAVQSDNSILLTYKTTADGIVNLFPGYDKLPADIQIVITSPDGTATLNKTLSTINIVPGQTLQFSLPVTSVPQTNIDIALVIDTTGSMSDEIRYLQNELKQVLKDTAANFPGASIRTGLVAYRDIGDNYVHEEFPFTADLAQFELDLFTLSADGGGDFPEAMDQGMNAAMKLNWRANSTKIALLVADAPPHESGITATWNSALLARKNQIHIVPVAASGVDKKAEFLMRSMAAVTNSRYIFLTDDSGVGNSHAEPTADCYLVTRLDSSIRRVVASLIKGNRVEPTKDEIIRSQGNYQAGVCAPLLPELPVTPVKPTIPDAPVKPATPVTPVTPVAALTP